MEGKVFGKKLAGDRKEAGLSQEQLASRLGVTPQALSKWDKMSGNLCVRGAYSSSFRIREHASKMVH